LAWLTRVGLNWRIDAARSARHLDVLDAALHVSFDVPTAESVDLRSALRTLSRGDQQLLLRVAGGMRYDELARGLGITPVAVRQRVARARLRLAKELSVDRKSVKGLEHDDR
jgi:DNA-directed RNA polymerase specialized sigma24 family protein